ncbi:uncharacterized protein LOC143147046 isoform X3 [Ptiloglossa arizonensis]
MDTSTCSSTGQNSLQSSAQRKFYQWVLKWINGIHASAESNTEETHDVRNLKQLDVPTLATFLQAIGFKLLSFEKNSNKQQKDENDISTSEPSVLKIAIECGSSNMRAILELGGITCRCPNPDNIKDASFWSVSGTGPTGSTDNTVKKVEETGSNLLPCLSKDITRVLRDVSYRLFETIVCEPDINRNTDASLNISQTSNASYESKATQKNMNTEIGVVRSYTEPEMFFRTNSLNSKCVSENQETIGNDCPISISPKTSPISSKKFTLQRQKTWDIDIGTGNSDEEPRSLPSKLPAVFVGLTNSLGQISLEDEIENPKNVTEYIIGAQQNLEKALRVLLLKTPIISVESPNQDHDDASVKSSPANISTAIVINTCKPTRSNTISSVKPLPTSNRLTIQQQLSTKPSLGNATQKLKVRRSIEPTLSKHLTQRNSEIEQENVRPPIRRSSSYNPSSCSSNFPIGQKLLGSGKYNAKKTNIAAESDFSNRSNVVARKVATPEPRIGSSQNLETFNVSNRRSTSMIKPPTKILKAIPIKIKPIQSTKIVAKIDKKPKISLSKE